ncbi:hypothetical protein F5Y15DRAFT_372324 [Xylariaceae sp. FL0016]|nr:hypothetical protein F5Y15DRAFT_372324 [Xylariaceae sp. FL0016]
MPPLPSPRDLARLVLESPPSSSSSTSPSPTIFARLATDVSTVPEGYGRSPSGPDAGTIVGIVLGSVAAFLIALWLIYWCVNLGRPGGTVLETGSVSGRTGPAPAASSVVSYHSRPKTHRARGGGGGSSRTHSHGHRRHSKRHSGSPRRDTVEIRRSGRFVPVAAAPPRGGSRPPRGMDPDEIVVEEEQVRRSVSRARAPPPPATPPAPRIVESDDDEIVVLEERGTPRRRDSRGYRRRSSERRSGLYRDVDPYGSVRDASRRRSGSGR